MTTAALDNRGLNGVGKLDGVPHIAYALNIPVIRNGETLNVAERGVFMVLVTPELAEKWLELYNKNNPRGEGVCYKDHVKFLAREITSGNWRTDMPEPISFTNTGRIGNGQHRLKAIVQSEMSVWVRIETGVSESVLPYFDGNKVRPLAQKTRFVEGTPTDNAKAAAITNTWHRIIGSKNIMTVSEARDFFSKHSDAIRWGVQVHTTERGIGRMPVLVACCEYYERSPDLADVFYNALRNQMTDIPQARMLREYLIRSSYSGGRTLSLDSYGKTVTACKYHADGKIWTKLHASNW